MSRLNRDQLVQLAKSQITEISAQELKQRLADGEDLTVVDIRERDEFVQWWSTVPVVSVRHWPRVI